MAKGLLSRRHTKQKSTTRAPPVHGTLNTIRYRHSPPYSASAHPHPRRGLDLIGGSQRVQPSTKDRGEPTGE